MPNRNGAEITENVLARKKDARILVITAYSTDRLAKGPSMRERWSY